MNRFEQQVYDKYKRLGYEVYRNGWPDFLVIKDGIGFGVEVKTGGNEGCCMPTENQLNLHVALGKLGLPVTYEWVPSLREYVKETPSEREARLLTRARSGKNKLKNA